MRNSIIFVLLSLTSTLSLAQALNCPSPWITSQLALGCEDIVFGTQVNYLYKPIEARAGYTKLLLTAVTRQREFGPLAAETLKQVHPAEIPLQPVYEHIRAGMMIENRTVPFKGNIVFYEGLGDSMLNHQQLFAALNARGYRVIAFDYMGQGGSLGSMNDTRIEDIPKLGEQVFGRFAREPKTSQKIIMGWSTGGLAAYMSAMDLKPTAIVLLTPGIVPSSRVGDFRMIKEFPYVQMTITLGSLTNLNLKGVNNPENPIIDPIKPISPQLVPDFAINLQLSALVAQQMKIQNVKGLVLLSGKHDSYIDAERTMSVLKSNAPGLTVIQYKKALHEIDNEVPEIADKVRADIIQFLDSIKL